MSSMETIDSRDQSRGVASSIDENESGVVASVHRRVPWLLVGLLTFSIGGSLAAHYILKLSVEGSEATLVERRKPASIDIASIRWASNAQNDDSKAWMVPIVCYLEDQAEAVVSTGSWKDALPILIQTNKFVAPTTEFDLVVTSRSGKSVYGYAYRVKSRSDATAYIPLTSTVIENNGRPVTAVSVPQCERGDSIALLLLISSADKLPISASTLGPCISFSVRARSGH